MSRGGGVRRPSVSSTDSPAPMPNNTNIPSTSSTSPQPPPPPANNSSTVQPSSSSSAQISQSQPSTPLHSTEASNGQAWEASLHNTGFLSSRSVVEGSEYPFHLSPSEPSTPLHGRPAEYTASTVSTNSAPPARSSTNPFQGISTKKISSNHSRKSSVGKSSGIVSGFKKVKSWIRIGSSPTGKDPLSPSAPSTESNSLARVESETGMGKNPESSKTMPGSPQLSLLDRRIRRNVGSGSGETIQPDQMKTTMTGTEINRQSIPSIPPVMLTPPDDDTKQIAWQAIPTSSAPVSQELPGAANTVTEEQTKSNSASRNSESPTETMKSVTKPSHTNDILESVLSNGFEVNEMWLKDALKVMLLSHPPDFRPASEAVRLISHALPCPLPSSPPARTPGETGPPNQLEPTVLPDSASEAPKIAAAAGYFMLPVTHGNNDGGESGGSNINGNNEGTTSALDIVTSAIQRVFGNDTKRIYIHVSHAISSNPAVPNLQSSNLTGSSVNSAATSAGSLVPSAFLTSPPHEGGFFSSTVFNSIVMAQDPVSYASPNGFPLSVLQRPLPNPALPPFSLHFSLLERYIPPATPAADSAMFSPYSSVLLDRVVELSPNGGSLLFIYPTKTGAKQFCERYLGKVLDPLLRRLMVLHRLRDDLLWGISRMVAVEQMQEFDDLKGKLEHFCRRLSEKCRDEAANEKQFMGPSLLLPVSLVHAQKVNVSLNQLSWREWWTSQESTRIREVVKNHFSKTSGHQDSPHGSQSMLSDAQAVAAEAGVLTPPGLATAVQYSGPMDLAREILDGVKASTARPSSRGMGEAVFASSMVGKTASWPVVGEGASRSGHFHRMRPDSETIEVGVFVLRRQL